MSASFPAAKKTFSQTVNGVTKLVAALFNGGYDEIEAIQTLLGATGRAQSYSDSFKNLLLSYRRGCKVEYKGDADLYVRLGEIMIPDASGNAALRRNTSDLTIDWTNIDTGAEENSTWYYVYATADASATTFLIKISKSASTPTGITYYKYLGKFYNNSAGDIVQASFLNSDDIKPVRIADVAVFPSAAAPTTFTDLDLSTYIGAQRARVRIKIKENSGSGTNVFMFRANGETDDMSVNNAYGGSAATIYLSTHGIIEVETDVNGVVEWKAQSNYATILTLISYQLAG